MVGPKFLFGPTIWVKKVSLIWRENGREGVSLFDEKLLICPFPLFNVVVVVFYFFTLYYIQFFPPYIILNIFFFVVEV